jgi:hypothetical protein
MSMSNIRSSSEFDRVVASLKAGKLTDTPILIDDGKFFIEQNVLFNEDSGGRLVSRRKEDQDVEGVLKECGSFSRREDGTWLTKYPEGRDVSLFAPSKSREDAIALLWFSRTLI